MASENENITLTAGGRPADQLHIPDRELIFQEYNPKWERFPLLANVMRGKAITEGNQEFKWDILYPEKRYHAVAPAGGETVGIYTAVDNKDNTFTTGGSTEITTTTTVANIVTASNGGNLIIRVPTNVAKTIHPLQTYWVRVFNTRNKDGATVTSVMPGRAAVDVRSMFAADTGYVGLICKVLVDDAIGGYSTLAQAAASGATAAISLGGGAVPEGYGITSGHLTNPFTCTNYTNINIRGFGSTRSRLRQREAWKNGRGLWDRLDAQNKATALCELDNSLWFGVKAKQTAQEGEMFDRNLSVKISGDRWYTGGIENFLLTQTDENGTARWANHVIYVPDLEEIGGISVAGQTGAEGLYDMFRGLGTEYATYTGKTTVPVYCGRSAYSDTIAMLENKFSRQIGQTTTSDKIGFTVNKLEIDGIVFEFRKHLGWFTDPAYHSYMGIADYEDISMHVFGEDGDFQLITEKERLPKSVSVGDTWKDGSSEAYFYDIGFGYANPDGMYLLKGVGLDFAAGD